MRWNLFLLRAMMLCIQISPKDHSLLEERIKRSGKKPQPASAAPPAASRPQAKMPAEDKHDAKQKPTKAKQQQPQRKSPVEDKEVPASDENKDEETTAPSDTKYVAYVYHMTCFDGEI